MHIKLSPGTPPAQLRVYTSCPSPGAARVTVIGEVDMATADGLRDELLNALAALHPRCFEVELAEVTFLDCSGVTALVVAGQAAGRTGCQLRIMNPQPVVRRVLTLTGLLGALTPDPGRAPTADSAAILTIPPPRNAAHAIDPGRHDPCDVGARH
jgi:anti-anti-sigma factor